MPLAVVMSESNRTYTPWGMLAAVDLHGCGFGPLADPDNIRAQHFGGTPTLRVLPR